MGAPYHNILSKLDRALVAYLIAQNAGTEADVFPAKRSQNKKLPCTICYSEKGEETVVNTGTYTIKSSIMVKTSAIDDAGQADGTARLTSEARVANTFDQFKKDVDSGTDKLAEDITNAARALAAADPAKNGDLADFTCQSVVDRGPEAGFDENDAWVDTLNLEIVACPGNVS